MKVRFGESSLRTKKLNNNDLRTNLKMRHRFRYDEFVVWFYKIQALSWYQD